MHNALLIGVRNSLRQLAMFCSGTKMISMLIAVVFVLALVFVFGTLWALIIGIVALGYLLWYVVFGVTLLYGSLTKSEKDKV